MKALHRRRWAWPAPLTYQVATQSDVGQRRMSNQDASGVLQLKRGILALVCDGMGGFQGGEVASRMTVASVIRYFKQVPLLRGHRLREHLGEAIRWANRQVWTYAQNHEHLRRMGTTVVALLCYRGWAYIAHVGDSRLYLLRDGALLQLTKDHSMVQRLLDAGELSEDGAAEHPRSNVISRMIGQFEDVEVECQAVPLRLAPGDRLLLCSDGLFRMVEELDILYQLREHASVDDACQSLVALANRSGGKDNITVQVIACAEAPSSLPRWLLGFVLVLVALLVGGWLI